VIPFPINKETSDKCPANDVAVPLSGELSGKMPEKTSEKMPEKTSEKILYLISENPRITTRELVDIIGIHERNVARNLKTLQDEVFFAA
jgi:predicted HTH transcriptional regulator